MDGKHVIVYMLVFLMGGVVGVFLNRAVKKEVSDIKILGCNVFFIPIINVVAYMILIIKYGPGLVSISYCMAASIFIAISVVDFKSYQIPIKFNKAVFILGCMRLASDIDYLYEGFVGMISVSGFMLVCLVVTRALKSVDAFGGGDIKLMAAVGLLVGNRLVWLSFILGCILAVIIHSIRMSLNGEGAVMALGPYLCMGAYLSMILGDEIINLYMKIL